MHAPLLARGQGVVHVEYRQFLIIVDGELPMAPPSLASIPGVVFDTDVAAPAPVTNGLISPRLHNGAVTIHTGIHTGFVSVTAEAHASEPSHDESWEETAEISIEAVPVPETPYGLSSVPFEDRMAEMRIATLDGGPADLPALNPRGPGPYRVRVSANNRNHNVDGADFEPVEQYLIQVWPGSRAPEALNEGSSNPS